MKLNKFFIYLFSVLICLFLFMVIYSCFIVPKSIVLNEQDLYLPNWNRYHNGLKIAVLSDFHIGRLGIDERQLQKIVDKTNEQNPDLILLLGDYDSLGIYYSKTKPENISNILSQFKAKYGVYTVLGNHDYDKKMPIKPIIERTDIKLLEDNSVTLNIDSKPLILYGVRDFWHYDFNENFINKNNSDSSILLTHNPDIFPLLHKNISLTLAGHTHGGQIYLPFLGGMFCSSVYEQRYIKGYIVENNKHLFVSSGIGNIGPARFGNLPEIVILNLYSQDSFPEEKIVNTKPRKGFSKLDTIPFKFIDHIRENYKPISIKYLYL